MKTNASVAHHLVLGEVSLQLQLCVGQVTVLETGLRAGIAQRRIDRIF